MTERTTVQPHHLFIDICNRWVGENRINAMIKPDVVSVTMRGSGVCEFYFFCEEEVWERIVDMIIKEGWTSKDDIYK